MSKDERGMYSEIRMYVVINMERNCRGELRNVGTPARAEAQAKKQRVEIAGEQSNQQKKASGMKE